ncbi:unnamed protein product [Hyaloperonospora brassicae]|uniref:RXLR phytopathogen effector protein WY-domain domain-containing protein n=1 Tax=Hyaloperonospora brassicae TaxID=162125 RepID=A0AAV0V0X9_HYABA|nr:unnamed protein product [Hyaloperonospora brassicae]
MVFAEFAERLHYWHLNLLERLNVHPSRTLSKFGFSPTASGFSNGVDGLQWLEHAVRYRSKNKKKGKELTDLELFKLLKKRLVHDENLLGVADRLRFQDENAAMKQLSVVFYRALLKDCSPATSKLMLDHWLGSMVVVPDDVFLALGIKVEDLVDHPAVVYQWLRHISEYRKAGSNKYTVEQIKEKLEGASEDQIRKFVDEALKQEDPVLVNMVKEVWGIERPGTVTETAVAT